MYNYKMYRERLRYVEQQKQHEDYVEIMFKRANGDDAGDGKEIQEALQIDRTNASCVYVNPWAAQDMMTDKLLNHLLSNITTSMVWQDSTPCDVGAHLISCKAVI